jgi:hypothetical protein
MELKTLAFVALLCLSAYSSFSQLTIFDDFTNGGSGWTNASMVSKSPPTSLTNQGSAHVIANATSLTLQGRFGTGANSYIGAGSISKDINILAGHK